MQSAICTLFEGHYHYGLGALVNSLYLNGFRGVIWAGYRGELPFWAKPLKSCDSFQEFIVAEGCVIRFVPVTANIHFTNYKPNFMLYLWEHYCPNTEAMFYFDPDIVIKCRWSFFEEWVGHGIALCQEIVNSSMPSDHPIRMAWKNYAVQRGFECNRSLNQYFNGGFIGIRKEYISALNVWKDLQEGLSNIGVNLSGQMLTDRTYPFYGSDQDVLNLMAMITPHPLSTIGPESMDFVCGGFTMSHAVGSPKPWCKKMMIEALKGVPPSAADKGYWQNTQTPIQLYPAHTLALKRFDISCAAAIGRIYRRS